MALDVWMLRAAGAHPEAVALFRAYGWSGSAFTFGQSQRWADIAARVEAITGASPEPPALVRRPTGGGLVDHRDDWTYALVFPAHSAPAAERPAALYARVHRLLAAALAEAGVAARLKVCPPPGECSEEVDRSASAGPSVCFEEPVPGDLLDPATGAKIAGAAMKRTRDGVLLQGSVVAGALASPAAREALRDAFAARFAQSFGAATDTLAQPPESTLEPLRATFRSAPWNRRR